MASQLYNNVTDTLASSLSAGATVLTVTDGSKFTNPPAGDYFPLYILASNGSHEIVHATAVSGNDITVLRAQEGTNPLTFAGGETVQVRPTRQALLELDASGMSVTSGGVSQTLSDAVSSRVLNLNTISDLSSVDVDHLVDGQQVIVSGYHGLFSNAFLYGGGVLVYQSSVSKSSHDGGRIFSPTVPFDWSDNGVAYLSGAGETDPSGSGCFVRISPDVLGPQHYGARATTNYDSYPSVHKALDAFLDGSTRSYVFDGDGLVYGVSLGYERLSAIFRKQIKNLYLEALPGFTGEAILKLTPSSGNLNDLRITDSTLKGAAGQSAPSNAPGLLLMDNTQGVWIDNCEFNIANDFCIKDLNPSAGAEVYISKCRIAAGSQYPENASAIGVWLFGNDSHVADNIIRECGTHAQFEKGAITYTGNHNYNFATNRNTNGIRFLSCQQCVINNNYFDGVKTQLTDPKNFTMTGNKFLIQNSDDWTGISAFVAFKAASAGQGLTDVTITGNFFRKVSGANVVRGFTVDESGGSWDVSLTDRVFIRNNTFVGVQEQTSHPSGTISYSAESLGSVDFTSLSPFGPDKSNPFRHVRSSCLNTADSPTGIRSHFNGTVVFVQLGASKTGTVVVEGTVNNSGA